MMNLWGVLLQAVEISIVSIVILILKKLFEDKLSPRWQYGIWILIAARMVIPSGAFGKYLSVNLAAYLEMMKTGIEGGLDSAYSSPYSPLEFSWLLPFGGAGKPVSVTDWIFVIYLVGVLLCLAKYAVSYMKLRRILHKGTEYALPKVAEDLPRCKAVMVDGIPSAFVCGVFRPILAVPSGSVVDEKVIMHELLHLKYMDALQSVFWCVLRSFNWWNPLMYYIFNRIGNDMESLCDQRVLERLEGEERREYGKILLSMTDEQYARAPGTTSISNGGKNIARRIKAIARFKKYPKGMGLVSVCIILVLAAPVFAGDQSAQLPENGWTANAKAQFEMAKSRLIRCTTPAGAIDTWVKGQVFNQPAYLAASSPKSAQEGLLTAANSGHYYIYELHRLDDINLFCREKTLEEYAVLNMTETGKHEYTADVVLICSGYDENSHNEKKLLSIPVKIYKENGWRVEQNGRTQKANGSGITDGKRGWGFERFSGAENYIAEGKTGTAKVKLQCIQTVNNYEAGEGNMFFGGGFQTKAKPDAEFESTVWNMVIDWKSNLSEEERKEVKHIRFAGGPIYGNDGFPEAKELQRQFSKGQKPERNGLWIDDDGKESKIWNGKLNHFTRVSEDTLDDITGFGILVYENHNLAEYIKIHRDDSAAFDVKSENKGSATVETCSTAAGAVDTFVKGLVFGSEEYLQASGKNVSRELVQRISEYVLTHDFSDYSVLNLKKISKDEYTAEIAIYEKKDEDDDGALGTRVISVRIFRDGSWFVEPQSEPKFGYSEGEQMEFYGITHVTPLLTATKKCETGMLFLKALSRTTVKGSGDNEANRDAQFGDTLWYYRADWKQGVLDDEKSPITQVGIAVGIVEDMDREPQWLANKIKLKSSQASGNSSTGWGYNAECMGVQWDGNICAVTGGMGKENYKNHEGVAVLLYENHMQKEYIKIHRDELK